MPNIDTLAIQFNANGTKKAVQNIKNMAEAVKNLADNLTTLDASKLQSFATSMETLKKSVPTKSQTDRMIGFANAVTQLSDAIGAANITSFSNDMSNLGQAVQAFKRSSVNGITNAVTAMQQLGQTAQTTANTVQSAAAKMPKTDSIQGSTTTAESVRTVVAELDKVASRTDAIKQKFKGLIVPTKGFKSLEEQADKVAKKYDELREKMQKALDSGEITAGSSAYEKMSAQLDGLRNQYDQLILKQKELALEGGGIQLNPKVTGTLQAFHSGFSKTANVIKSGFTTAIRSANKHLSSMVKHLFNADKAASVLKKADLTKSAKNLAKELLRVSKMLKLMVTRMALRAVIAEVSNGFKSLAIHSDEFNNSVSSMMNAAKQLGYSFSAMVAPLINALAPAIEYIISLLVKLLNVFNQVISALTGASTWNRAKKFTDSWRDSITGAGKAASKTAKELKKTVLGFDELNQLQDNKSSDSGGGAGGLADMFETVKIDPKWKNFADWLKEMWKNKDFYDLGKLIGTKLRDALESIPWDKIRKTSNDLGKALATLINGFVEVERLAFDIGYTVAQGVNTVFEFLNGFVHNLHWDSIGKFIAEIFNGFFETIDWPLIKDTVVTGLAGIAQAIQSFIDEFHWDNISNFIINAVDTIVSGIKAFFEGIKWKDLGSKIGDQITKTVKGINWREVGQALGDIVQSAIDFLSGLIEKLNVDDVVRALTELINGFFDKVDMEEAGKNLGKILHGLIEFIKKFWDENGDTIKTEIGNFFKGLFSELDFGDVASILMVSLGIPLLSGVLSVIGWVAKTIAAQTIGKLITDAIFGGATSTIATEGAAAGAEAAGAVASGATSGEVLGSATVAGSTIGTTLVGAIGAAIAFFGGAEIGKISWKWLYPDELDDLKEKYGGLGGTIQLFKDTADAAWYEVKEAAKTFGERTVEHIDNFKDDVKSDYDTVQEATKVFKERTAEHWENLKTDVKQHTDTTKEAVRVFGERTSEHLSDLSTDASTHLDTTKEAFRTFGERTNEHLSDFKEQSSKTFDDIKEAAKVFDERTNEHLTDLKEKASENFDNIVEAAKTFAERTGEHWEDARKKIETFKDDAKAEWDTIKDNFMEFKDKLADAMDSDSWTFSGVAEGLKKTFEKAKEAVKDVWNGIADTLNGNHEIGSSNIKINLPKFAMGGFPEDGLFMASHHELVGEFSNGKTAVANNAQIIEGIQAGVYNAVTRAMANTGGNDKYIVTEINVDGEKLATAVSKGQDKQNRRYSPSMA